MVYAFALPTTSHLSFQSFISSPSHPSLPQAASTARHALRLALKTHKRLPRGAQQDSHLTTVQSAITDYLPYLAAISSGISHSDIYSSSSEPIEITQHSEIESAWRATLTPNSASSALALKNRSSAGRLQGPGLAFEIAFVLSSLAYSLSNLAHSTVTRSLYNPSTPSPEQRTAAIQSATKSLLQASAIHSLIANSSSSAHTPQSTLHQPPDILPATHAALSSLALAEATLLAVLKDDSYVAACIQARNPNDKDWMVRAPEIPKVRAHLFARLCIRAAEYADQAAAGLGAVSANGKLGLDEDLVKYARVLARVVRARACRFFGVDAELAGKIGDGIAWLRAAKGALGLRGGQTENQKPGAKGRGLSKLKQGWMERREERRMEKEAGGSRERRVELGPGDNAGREEEGRVIEMLETKWVRMNDTINTQLIPPSADLLANLPSGRDIHSPPPPYRLPALEDDQLARMRAPPSPEDFGPGSDEDSEEETSPPTLRETPGIPERTDSAYY